MTMPSGRRSQIAGFAATMTTKRPWDSSRKRKGKRIAELKEAFWKARDDEDCWQVPMGRDLQAMPWLSSRSVGVLEAIRRARMNGKVALLVDNSKHRVVDTFFAYRNCQILEAKQLVLEERTGKRSRPQILEEARKKARQCPALWSGSLRSHEHICRALQGGPTRRRPRCPSPFSISRP